MRKNRNIIVAIIMIMILSISLVGCKKEKEKEQDEVNKEEELEEDTVVLKVNKDKIYYNEVIVYVQMLKQEYEPSLGEDIWDFGYEAGRTFTDVAKEEIIEEVSQLKIICKEGENLGIKLNEDEETEVKETASTHFAEISSKDKETYGITLELLESIYSEHVLAQKVFDEVTMDVSTEITDEEAKQITIQQIYLSTEKTDEDGNNIPLSEKELSKARKKAKELYKKAKEVEDFESFAIKNTQDTQIEYTIGKGESNAAIEEAAFALKSGEMSKVIETDTGIYIIYCVSDFNEDATAQKKEDMISERQKEKFEEMYSNWALDYEVTVNTPVWDKVTFR